MPKAPPLPAPHARFPVLSFAVGDRLKACTAENTREDTAVLRSTAWAVCIMNIPAQSPAMALVTIIVDMRSNDFPARARTRSPSVRSDTTSFRADFAARHLVLCSKNIRPLSLPFCFNKRVTDSSRVHEDKNQKNNDLAIRSFSP